MMFHDDELDDKLKDKLRLLAPTAPRDPQKAANGRVIFLKNASQHRARYAHLLAVKQPKRGFLQAFFGKNISFAPLAVAIVIAIGLILGTGWGTVYAAQDSLPNDLLYPVKLAAENVRLTFSGSTETRVALLTDYTERRVEEAYSLAAQGEAIPEELPNMVDEQLDEIFTLAASMDVEAMEAALTGVQRHLRPRDQIQGMTNAMEGQPDDVDPQLTRLLAMLQERQEIAKSGLEEPNKFQQQFRYQQGKPTLPITTTLTSTLTETVTTTLTITPEITVSLTITPGQYGPGPCETPGSCTPPAEDHGPFQHQGTPPGPNDHEGYGPGSDQGEGPHYPTLTPIPGNIENPTETPDPDTKSQNNGGIKNKP